RASCAAPRAPKGAAATATGASASQQSRLLAPQTATGANDGLSSTTTKGQPNRRPRATAAAIHMSLFPAANEPEVRGQNATSPRIGQTQTTGRQRHSHHASVPIGRAHHNTAGSQRKGTISSIVVGG